MFLEQAYFYQFRNLGQARFHFSPQVNLVLGPNGSGKTNLLEGISLALQGKSFRPAREDQLIHWDQDRAQLGLELTTAGFQESLRLDLVRGQAKTYWINQEKVQRLADIRALYSLLTFVPEDLKIIKEGKAYRRTFLDDMIETINPAYEKIRQDYQRALAQRNYLLKLGGQPSYYKEQIMAINKSLASFGAYLVYFRQEYRKRLVVESRRIHQQITGEILDFTYDSPLARESLGQIQEAFIEDLVKNFPQDRRRGYTSVGPHRDDLIITLDGRLARDYGSQGQQRTAVLSMKLAQLSLLEYYRERKPLILLDDIFSELDRERVHFLMGAVKDFQVFISSTDNPLDQPVHIIPLRKE